jgi:cytochrome c oxidase assembly protein Cox11
MPVLFFIDKDFLSDPSLTQTETVTLSYTFFKAGEEDQSFVEGECVRCEVGCVSCGVRCVVCGV